jgi:hypothetical protein
MKKSQEEIRQAAQIIRDFEKRVKHLKDGYLKHGLALANYNASQKIAQNRMFKELKDLELSMI